MAREGTVAGQAGGSETGPAGDGRVQRGARNREAILESLYELVREGELQPTAEQVAQRAGVGTRTVFRHFADMESLHAEIAARVEREVAPLAGAPAVEGGLEERARALTRQRAAVFERIAPFKRSGALHRRASPFLERRHAAMVRRLRADLLRVLAELERAPAPLLEALDLLLSFEAWDRLRSDQRLGRDRAQGAMEHAVLALLRTIDGGA
jgi:AcrR family transcriptional regulator